MFDQLTAEESALLSEKLKSAYVKSQQLERDVIRQSRMVASASARRHLLREVRGQAPMRSDITSVRWHLVKA